MDRLRASFHFDILGFWPELKLQTSSVTVSAHRLPLAQTQTEIRLEVINLGGRTCWGNKHSTSTPICIQSYLFASNHHVHFLAVGKKGSLRSSVSLWTSSPPGCPFVGVGVHFSECFWAPALMVSIRSEAKVRRSWLVVRWQWGQGGVRRTRMQAAQTGSASELRQRNSVEG